MQIKTTTSDITITQPSSTGGQSNIWIPNPRPWPYQPWDPWIYPRPPRPRPRRPVRRIKRRRKAPVRHLRRKGMAKKGKKETYVTLVLDRSTSMHICHEAALDAINEQIDTIRENAHKGGKTYVSLVLFSDVIDIVFENVPAEEVSQLEMAEYKLMGCTALRDAMVTAIDLMEDKYDGNKNQGFLAILISDGQENSSGTSREELQRRIEECESTDAWTFSYMLDGHSWEQVQDMSHYTSTPIGNFATFTSDDQGTRDSSDYLASNVASYMDARSENITKSENFYNTDGSGKQVDASKEGSKAKTK